MNRRTTRSLTLAAAAILAVGALSACTGSKKQPVAAASSTTSSAAPSSSATPTPTRTKTVAPVVVNYLTGVGAPSTRPVIAVKIDDTENGRPQREIDKADIVYIEQAEGGLSRLVAVFGTNYPVVGYVRSTRPSDPDLLLQYGRITLAASGGGGDALPILDSSGLTPWINDRGAGFYVRAPHDNDHGYVNLTLNLSQVAATVKTPAAKSIGFTWSSGFGATTFTGGAGTLVTSVGSTRVEFRWDASIGRYVRYIDGVRQAAADGAPVSTPNVIVQECQISPHYGDVDVNGNPSQFTTTVGTGRVRVFRNGHYILGTWTRSAVTGGTVLRDTKGHIIPLAPGGAWVALVATGTAVAAA